MKLFFSGVLMLLAVQLNAQKFVSNESFIKFYSEAPLEDIEATNETAKSVIDMSNGELVFSVAIKDFEFEKSLMQEHFNENYLESEKYPKSTFKAKIQNWSGAKGESTVKAVGQFEIHGVTKDVEIEGKINYSDDKVVIDAVFPVKLQDYKIKIPKAVFYNIAEEVEVTIKFTYAPYSSSN
ncbi:MAG: YceI family protein [bacterium]|nr:YceI family protein [bacterium]